MGRFGDSTGMFGDVDFIEREATSDQERVDPEHNGVSCSRILGGGFTGVGGGPPD